MGVEQQMKDYINQKGKPHIIYFHSAMQLEKVKRVRN